MRLFNRCHLRRGPSRVFKCGICRVPILSRLFACLLLSFPLVASATPQASTGENETGSTIPSVGANVANVDNATGVSLQHLDRIDELVAKDIAAGNIPGCVVLIAQKGQTVFHRAYGHRQLQPEKLPMEKDTVFDMASITKPVATATSIMLLVERGQLRLNDKYGHYIEEFNQNGKEDVTIRQMLTHTAGFVPDSPLSEYKDADQIWPNLWRLGLEYEPTTKFVYSDVGFQLLGKLVEKISGQTLDAFTAESIFRPLGMTESGFLPSKNLQDRAATTEQREGRWMRGEVHDPRSYAMGRVAGHAGLFSTAEDLAKYAQMILGNGAYNGTRILSPQTVATMKTPTDVAGNMRALGWDVLSRYSTNRGELMTDQAIGHGGFTGTAMWIDSGLDLAVIFLSNRVHPNGKGTANRLAGRIASVAAAAVVDGKNAAQEPVGLRAQVGGSVAEKSTKVALPGIDVLVKGGFSRLNKDRVGRIGLITNHTGVARSGRRTVDLLHESRTTDLTIIFSPEHGIHGVRDEKVADARDESTGLPIFSLYGENRSPTKDALAKIDSIVFDIQDIGTRFYTYISTMLNAMRSAADHDKKFVVLDRPNPLGGIKVAGPVLDEGKESFVGCHPIAVQHGMTVGELARMFVAELELSVDLEVVAVENWPRDMLWPDTGLTWVNPSPNMRSWTEALLYPGIGLLETTNLSVGRGTDRPFEIIGAPYIEPTEFAAALNSDFKAAKLEGLKFVPRYITPDASKFKDEKCGAVDIIVTDSERVAAVETGLMIAATLRRLYPDDWDTADLNRLLIDDKLFAAIQTGKPYEVLAGMYREEREAFRKRRESWLIYP